MGFWDTVRETFWHQTEEQARKPVRVTAEAPMLHRAQRNRTKNTRRRLQDKAARKLHRGYAGPKGRNN